MIIEHKRFDLFQKMIFEKAVLKAPFRITNDMPNEACFLYILKGEQKVSAAVEQLHLHPHEAVLMKCGLYFGNWLKKVEFEECEAIAIHFYPEVLRQVYEKEIPKFIRQVKNPGSMYKVASDELIKKYIESILFYFDNPALVDEELVLLKLKELILLLSKTENASSIIELISSLFSEEKHNFREVVEANLYSDLNVGQLAQLANMSLSTFKREFKKTYRQSPARYLKNKKLERAAELLAVSDQRVTEVAFDCGFNDAAHFTRSFHEKYGLSPSRYRLSQKRNSLT